LTASHVGTRRLSVCRRPGRPRRTYLPYRRRPAPLSRQPLRTPWDWNGRRRWSDTGTGRGLRWCT